MAGAIGNSPPSLDSLQFLFAQAHQFFIHASLGLCRYQFPDCILDPDIVCRSPEFHRASKPALEQVVLANGWVLNPDTPQYIVAAGHVSNQLSPGGQHRIHYKIVVVVVGANGVEAYGFQCALKAWSATGIMAGEE